MKMKNELFNSKNSSTVWKGKICENFIILPTDITFECRGLGVIKLLKKNW